MSGFRWCALRMLHLILKTLVWISAQYKVDHAHARRGSICAMVDDNGVESSFSGDERHSLNDECVSLACHGLLSAEEVPAHLQRLTALS